MNPSTLRIFAPLCILALLAAGFAAAQETPSLPTGKEVVDRAVEVSGGKEAHKKLNNRVITGKIAVVGAGLTGTFTSYNARPNLSYVKIDLAGLAVVERGSNGEVLWEINSMTGPRIVEGNEAEMLRIAGRFDDSEFADIFDTIECVGEEVVDGEATYKVILKSGDLDPLITFFSKGTGLPVMTRLTLNTQMGKITAETLVDDYRPVDGVLIPHFTIEKAMGQEIEMTIESVQHNTDIPPDRFAIPPQIQALIDQKAQSEPADTTPEP